MLAKSSGWAGFNPPSGSAKTRARSSFLRSTDPSLIYTVDYRWYGDYTKDELAVVKISGDKAYLQGSTVIDGYVGQVFVQGNKAYASAERYTYSGDTYTGPRVKLHEIDLTNPKAPVDRVSTEKK